MDKTFKLDYHEIMGAIEKHELHPTKKEQFKVILKELDATTLTKEEKEFEKLKVASVAKKVGIVLEELDK